MRSRGHFGVSSEQIVIGAEVGAVPHGGQVVLHRAAALGIVFKLRIQKRLVLHLPLQHLDPVVLLLFLPNLGHVRDHHVVDGALLRLKLVFVQIAQFILQKVGVFVEFDILLQRLAPQSVIVRRHIG